MFAVIITEAARWIAILIKFTHALHLPLVTPVVAGNSSLEVVEAIVAAEFEPPELRVYTSCHSPQVVVVVPTTTVFAISAGVFANALVAGCLIDCCHMFAFLVISNTNLSFKYSIFRVFVSLQISYFLLRVYETVRITCIYDT